MLESGSLLPDQLTFSGDLVEILGGELVDKSWREDTEGTRLSVHQVVVSRLHAHDVHKTFPSHFVVSIENVVKIIDGMFNIAHIAGNVSDFLSIDPRSAILVSPLERFCGSLES